jgi:hypothetical protein
MRKRFRRRLSQRCCLLGVFVTVAPWIQGAAAQSAEEMMGVKQDHCSMAQRTLDGRTFVCMVWDHDPARFSDPTQIEIYRGHKKMYTIQPGGAQYAKGTSGMTANNLPSTMDLAGNSELSRCTMRRLESGLIGCLDPCSLACCRNGPRVHHN